MTEYAIVDEGALSMLEGRRIERVTSMSAAELRDCGWPDSCCAWKIEVEGGVTLLGCSEDRSRPSPVLMVVSRTVGLWTVRGTKPKPKEKLEVKP